MNEFLSIVIIVFALLQVILFFRIWGMTNNVSKIRKIIEIRLTNSIEPEYRGDDITVGDLVVLVKSERQLKVDEITNDGRYVCKAPGGIKVEGTYGVDEIELFDKYWDKKKKLNK